MDPKKNKPKSGSQPMNVDPATASRMSSLPAGGTKNIKIKPVEKRDKMKKVRPEVRQRLMAKLNTPTPGGDVDPETGDLVDHIIHEIAFTRKGRAARAADQVEPSAPIPPESKVSDAMMDKALKKAMSQYKPKPKPNDQTPPSMNTEGVQKTGHPEAFELGLDGETISNPEYQKILRRKRIERAMQMSDPKQSTQSTDDVSQDDVVAADKAARGKKFSPRNVGKDAY